MSRIISALLLGFSSALALAAPGGNAPLELAADAPERHIVVPGDTLWGISGKFLKEPMRWPELWRMNSEEVRNPHRIYPGQVLVLDRSDGTPRLKVGRLIGQGDHKLQPRVYIEEERQEIPAIPQQVIEPFLSQPLVVEATGLDSAPRIVATDESRVYVGVGDKIYAAGMNGDKARSWLVYRVGRPLVDPDSREVLGHEAVHLGSTRMLAEGEPATLEVVSVRQEIGRGDRLVPAGRPEVISYAPHTPIDQIRGRVIGIYGGVGEGGRHSVVSISRGKRDGLEVGNVLALYRAGAQVTNRFDPNKPEVHKLPDERYGLVFVFRVFDRVSYALVTDVSRPVVENDVVRTP